MAAIIVNDNNNYKRNGYDGYVDANGDNDDDNSEILVVGATMMVK